MNKSTTSRRNKNAARKSSGDVGEHGLRGPHFKIEGHRPGPHNRDTTKPLLTCTNLKKSYRKAAVEIPVLRGVDLEIYEGEFQSIVGQSGSGKSTLLHILATLDQPDSGEIHFEGNRIDNIQARGRDTLRIDTSVWCFNFITCCPNLRRSRMSYCQA